jgi:hypothetical protein
MPQIFSTMLNEVIDDEFEAPAYTNPAQFAKSMEPSSFEYGSIWHQLLQFHVQFHSKMLQDHESINRKGSCVKKLEKNLREKFGEFLNLDLKL